MSNNIEILGATTHNLKNLSLDVPKDMVVAFTGVSGSGKSSLVFDTIYTEAQRQLIETFSSFARGRLPKLSRPPVEEIRNLATAIVIDQKRMGTNLRSTVGTATEMATYLRLLFSRVGRPSIGPSFYFSYNNPEGMCPECHGFGRKISIDINLLLDPTLSLRGGAIQHPDYKPEGWMWREIMAMELFDVDTPVESWDAAEVERLLHAESIPIVKCHGAGIYSKNFVGIARKLEQHYVRKGETPSSQSRRNAYDRFFVENPCVACDGSRINERARTVLLEGRTIAELSDIEIEELDHFLAEIRGEVTAPLVSKMRRILGHLIHIGVGYLSLNRPVATLSGGESQRVKMARQLDCDLVGLLYILDEPSIGLHPRDIAKLVEMLRGLRDRGNSVLVVEHDPEIITGADWIVDIGPVAGKGGGEVLYNGELSTFQKADTVTARAIFGKASGRPTAKRREPTEWYSINNVTANNLKNISVRIPMGVFTCVTGVAGSGKSSLIHDEFCRLHPEAVVVDQSPVGRSSRSNPATYIKVFDDIRKAFAEQNGVKPALFSFNSAGACPKCKGLGRLSVEMSFLDDVTMTCDGCDGMRYTDEVLKLRLSGKNIFDVLCMTIDEAAGFFDSAKVQKRLEVLRDVGLGYLEVGQPLSTLSGGEAQRIKLASELHKEGNLYVMDEPTTGLHPADIERLLSIITSFVDRGNTVVVIEHNIDVIKMADWVIDLGPEGGRSGGEVIAEGTPEQIAAIDRSYTGKYLASRPGLWPTTDVI
jgi:excinuclease UvrABC ATPase subunit